MGCTFGWTTWKHNAPSDSCRRGIKMLLALLFVHCKSLQRCLSPLSKDEVFLYRDCEGHSIWFTTFQRVLCIFLLKDISPIRIWDSRFKVFIVMCTVRKHVSLYNEILPLLSTECQQCRGRISFIHLNPIVTLDQHIRLCFYHHHQCWFIPPAAILSQSRDALNLFECHAVVQHLVKTLFFPLICQLPELATFHILPPVMRIKGPWMELDYEALLGLSLK